MMLPLSLSESAGTFVGLEVQTLLRGALGPAPILVILSGASYNVLNMVRRSRTLVDLAIYLFASTLIFSMTWPTTATVSPSDIQAQAADGPVGSAAHLLPGRSDVQIPRIEADLLRAVSSMWVDVGRAINDEGDRPFSEVAPMAWLMQQRLTADTVSLIRDWTSNCIMPARKHVLQTGGSLSYEDLLPFSGSSVFGAMSNMTRTVQGSQTSCSGAESSILSQVSNELASAVSPGGNSLSAVWSDELGISADEASKFMIMREVTRASGPEIQPTSLLGLYGSVRAARSLSSGLADAVKSALNFKFGDAAAHVGNAITGGAGSALHDLALGIEQQVGKALFITKFSSDIAGVLQAVILSVFPLVVMVSLLPGKHIMALGSYLYLVFAVYSMPLAWSLIDLLSDIALSHASVGGLVTDPLVNLEAYASALVIVTFGTWVALFGLAFAILLPVAGSAIGVVRGARGI